MQVRSDLYNSVFRIFVSMMLSLITIQFCNSQILKPGDKMLDVKFKYIEANEIKEINFSSLKGKLVILDFWNIWCSTCLASMPKLDSLQKKYRSEIQIFLVTDNTINEVRSVFKSPYLKNVNLPMIIQDSVLLPFFPHQTVPHHVWILPDGTIKYITYGDNATDSNISYVLKRNFPALSYKNEIQTFDHLKPLWSNENQFYTKHIAFYSYLADWLEEYGGGGRSQLLDSVSKTVVGIRLINEQLLSLYQIAYGGFDKGIYEFRNRIILDVKTKERFLEPDLKINNEIDEWRRANLFSYELKVPTISSRSLYQFMRLDLERYFPFTAVIEKRSVKCLTLVRINPLSPILSNSQIQNQKKTNESIVINNKSISKSLLRGLQLAHSESKMPIIDLTNFSENINIVLNCSYSNIGNLRQELQRYNLDLIEKNIQIDMLVIRDKKR